MSAKDTYNQIQAAGDNGSTILVFEDITGVNVVPGVGRPVAVQHFSVTVGKQVKEKINYLNPASHSAWAAERSRTYFDVENYP